MDLLWGQSDVYRNDLKKLPYCADCMLWACVGNHLGIVAPSWEGRCVICSFLIKLYVDNEKKGGYRSCSLIPSLYNWGNGEKASREDSCPAGEQECRVRLKICDSRHLLSSQICKLHSYLSVTFRQNCSVTGSDWLSFQIPFHLYCNDRALLILEVPPAMKRLCLVRQLYMKQILQL